MDKLRITGLSVTAIIGIRKWERYVRQPLRIDVECDVDAARAAKTDDIAEALDYGRIARRIVEFVSVSECHLIETLAERVAALLHDEFPVTRCRIVVHKPSAIPYALDTSIEIERPAP